LQIKLTTIWESLIIVCLGAAVGLIIAFWSGAVFRESLLRDFGVRPDYTPWNVIGLMMGIYLVAAIVSGIVTVHQTTSQAELRASQE
jgi:hypothetical protein